jgi:hypothetical protein
MAVQTRKWPRRAVRLLLAALLAAACGCGNTATVSGKVAYHDRPVVYGSVIILSADHTAHSGVIKPDGSYAVEGVHPGEVKVGVISRDPSKAPRGTVGAKEAAAGGNWFPLPRELEDPETSGLSYTVGAGGVRQDIDLK